MQSTIRSVGLGVVMVAMLALTLTIEVNAQNAKRVDVWKDPFCGCCAKWIDQMKAAGFEMRVHDTQSLHAIKKKHGIPPRLQSCHTAKVGGYVVEGHVPIADVQRLLKQKPNVIGISVPGMPLGSPGMEVSSGEKEPYEVLTFDKEGVTSTFAKHN